MKKITKTIRVCDECDTPLIWTFYFDYCERYCLNCGAKGGMLGTGHDIEATKDVIFQKRLVDAIWKVLYGRKGLLPQGRYNKGKCAKCGPEYHNAHTSPTEKEWNEVAMKYLERFKGTFSPHQ